MLAAPLTGWLGDRFPRKPLIIAGAVLWSVATLGTAWVPRLSGPSTSATRWSGVGEATFGIFAPAVLADFYPERDRNRILSIFYLAIPVGAALGYLAGGQLGTLWGWRAPFFICAIPGLVIAALYGWMGPRAGARRQRPRPPTVNAPRSSALHATRPFSRPPSAWPRSPSPWAASPPGCRTFLHRSAGLSVGNASLVVGAITVVDGIAGTLVGGWIAQRWLRTNHRALYLLSFWSVALTLPCGALVFFGPRVGRSRALRRRVLPLPQHRPAQRRHRQLGLRAGARHGHLIQPLHHSLLRRHVFAQIIGAISDRSNLSIGLGATLIFLVVSASLGCTIPRTCTFISRYFISSPTSS
jgi:MFS transporter, Spinster family, sphingosine-1-phosphate transporter